MKIHVDVTDADLLHMDPLERAMTRALGTTVITFPPCWRIMEETVIRQFPYGITAWCVKGQTTPISFDVEVS